MLNKLGVLNNASFERKAKFKHFTEIEEQERANEAQEEKNEKERLKKKIKRRPNGRPVKQ